MIRPFSAVYKRELLSYFYSPLAYAILAAFLLLNGGIYFLILTLLNQPQAPHGAVLKAFFGGTLYYWMYILFIAPLLTMRLISEEKRSGTIELLMTAPVTEAQVVLGKYFAALTFYAFLWVFTLIYVIIVATYSTIDPMPILSGYLGVLLHGALFLSAGLLASAFSKNQIISFIWAFALLMALFTMGFMYQIVADPTAKSLFEYATLWEQMDAFGKGILDTRPLVYSLSLTVFFLYMTTQILRLRRWR
jgi:ABC-2 type transport system permease protein